MDYQFEQQPSTIDSGFRNVSENHGQINMFESQNPTFRTRRGTRTNVATNFDDIQFTDPRPARRKPTGPKVQYVEAVSKTRKSKKIKAKRSIEWTWSKIGWIFCALLVGRLVFMDRGLIDFNSMDNTIVEKHQELEELKLENKELEAEIHKIRISPQYQKKIAREHLGVIAKDEYLVLFSSDH